jgi:hypothetical protein
MKQTVKLTFRTVLLICILAFSVVSCSSNTNSDAVAKPTKQELTDHFVSLAQGEDGNSSLIPKETLEKVYGCLFDESYDKLSAETLVAMKEVKEFDGSAQYPVDLNAEEKKIFDDASATCEEKFKDDPSLNFDS